MKVYQQAIMKNIQESSLLIESNRSDVHSDCSFKDQLIISGCNESMFIPNAGVER